jgi:hypothetical protein
MLSSLFTDVIGHRKHDHQALPEDDFQRLEAGLTPQMYEPLKVGTLVSNGWMDHQVGIP